MKSAWTLTKATAENVKVGVILRSVYDKGASGPYSDTYVVDMYKQLANGLKASTAAEGTGKIMVRIAAPHLQMIDGMWVMNVREDDLPLNDVIQSMITGHGWMVLCAEDGEDSKPVNVNRSFVR